MYQMNKWIKKRKQIIQQLIHNQVEHVLKWSLDRLERVGILPHNSTGTFAQKLCALTSIKSNQVIKVKQVGIQVYKEPKAIKVS